MDWSPTTWKKMMDVLEAVVPEQFRAIALDSVQTDATKFAQERSAHVIEDQDLVRAISLAPSFIQPELLKALKAMDVDIEIDHIDS